jgi:hypothetical protein
VSSRCAPEIFGVVACCIAALALAAVAQAHPGGRYVTKASIERTMARAATVDLAICRGRGRPLAPAAAPLLRYKHFSCVMIASNGSRLCANVHVLRTGRLVFGRIYDGDAPSTPPSVCGA